MRHMIKVGNSYAVLVPRAVMSMIGLKPDTQFSFAAEGKNLILKPEPNAGQEARDRAVTASANRFFKKYHETLVILADT